MNELFIVLFNPINRINPAIFSYLSAYLLPTLFRSMPGNYTLIKSNINFLEGIFIAIAFVAMSGDNTWRIRNIGSLQDIVFMFGHGYLVQLKIKVSFIPFKIFEIGGIKDIIFDSCKFFEQVDNFVNLFRGHGSNSFFSRSYSAFLYAFR